MKAGNLIALCVCLFASVGCSSKNDEKSAIEKEFDDFFHITNESVDIEDASFFGIGGITITNNTVMDWVGVQVNLNPPMDLNKPDDIVGFARRVKDIVMVEMDQVDGFLAPASRNQYYGPVKKGGEQRIAWGKFMHNKTSEKFSTSRYTPNKMIVTFHAMHKDKSLSKKEIFIRGATKPGAYWGRNPETWFV